MISKPNNNHRVPYTAHELTDRFNKLRQLQRDYETVLALPPSRMKDKLVADFQLALSCDRNVSDIVAQYKSELESARSTIASLKLQVASRTVQRHPELIQDMYEYRQLIADSKWFQNLDKVAIMKRLDMWISTLNEQ